MRLLKRGLILGLLPLLLLFSTVFASIPVNAQSANASTYTYSNASNLCETSDDSPAIAIVETSQGSSGALTYHWCPVSEGSSEFARDGTSDRIVVAAANPQQATRQTAAGQNTTVSVGNAELFSQQPANASDTDSEDSSCESIGNWAWAVCPAISFLSGAINWMDERIQGMLAVGEDRYRNPELHAAWINFRNIAYVILIPIMLVMVIGTALGFDIFSAYTVKKALPRMALAIMFITLSWHITTFFISFFNVLGGGILGLMTAPFGIGHNMSLETLFGVSGSNAGDIASTAGSAAVQWTVTLGALAGLAVMAGSPGGLAILALYLAPVILFVLTAFLALMLREIFILAGVLLAPIAILAWIFPGNDGLWKLWWNTFSKLLMMFPLIMIIIGAGRIAAHLIDISGGGGVQSIINPLLKLTAYILPYMFIPFTFKFAGGVFANLAGIVNDREKGLFDRIRKNRGARMEEFRRRAGRSSLYDQERAKHTGGFKGRWMRGINNMGGWMFDPISNAQVRLGTEKGKAIMSQVWAGKAEDSQKLAEVLGKMSFNAEELSTLAYGAKVTIRNAKGELETVDIKPWDGSGQHLMKIADTLSMSVNAQERIGGAHLRENAGFLTQVTRSEEYGRANVRAALGLAHAAQGFATPERIAQLSNELGPGLGSIVKTQAELFSARAGGLGKPGYTVRYGEYVDAEGKLQVGYYAPTKIEGAKIEQVVRSGVQDLSSAKGSQLSEQLGDAIHHILTADASTTWINADGQEKTIGSIRNGVEETLVQVLGSYAPADVKRRIADMLVKAKTQTLVGQTRNVIEDLPDGRKVSRTVKITEANAAEWAEREVRALLNRTSGNINLNELMQEEQRRQQENK